MTGCGHYDTGLAVLCLLPLATQQELSIRVFFKNIYIYIYFLFFLHHYSLTVVFLQFHLQQLHPLLPPSPCSPPHLPPSAPLGVELLRTSLWPCLFWNMNAWPPKANASQPQCFLSGLLIYRCGEENAKPKALIFMSCTVFFFFLSFLYSLFFFLTARSGSRCV